MGETKWCLGRAHHPMISSSHHRDYRGIGGGAGGVGPAKTAARSATSFAAAQLAMPCRQTSVSGLSSPAAALRAEYGDLERPVLLAVDREEEG